MTWGGPARPEAMATQVSLERLVAVAERLGRDAVVLLDRAAFDGETIPSASVEAEVCFANEEDRVAFLGEFLAVVTQLTKKYGRRAGEGFRVALVVHPEV
jgi:hypothetical protein